MDQKKKTPIANKNNIAKSNRVLNITPKKDDSFKRIFIISTSVIVALAIIWGIVSALAIKQGNESITNSMTKIDRSISGKTPEDDKKDATNAVTKMLKDFDNSPVNKTTEERINSIDENDFSVLNNDAINDLYFTADADDTFKKNAYQALVTFSSIVKKQSPDQNTIATRSDTIWSTCYSDSTDGIVYVPLNIYNSNAGTGFSFEMVYKNGKWLLSPYGILDSIKLLSATNSTDASYPSATASPTK